MAILRNLELSEWRQFFIIDINFHPKLTILTGSNGAGKTTILYLIGHLFGWQVPFISEPRINRKGILEYVTSFLGIDSNETQHKVGQIVLSDNTRLPLALPSKGGPTYNIQVSQSQSVRGVFIPSHRPVFSFTQVTAIPPAPRTRDEIAAAYSALIRARHITSQHTLSPTYSLKENLIALALYGHGNPAVAAFPAALEAFEEFNEILTKILPPSLGFKKLRIHSPEVVLVTETGSFSIDAASGGISALIDIAWQIYMTAPRDSESIVVIDEPENHLHPELQRLLMPSLIDAFPKVQFICATHNPLIISSVRDSNTYALRYETNNRLQSAVYSSRIDLFNKSGTADDILREVLGIPAVTPNWVAQQILEVVRQFEDSELTNESLMQFRSALIEYGLEKHIPQSLERLSEIKDRD